MFQRSTLAIDHNIFLGEVSRTAFDVRVLEEFVLRNNWFRIVRRDAFFSIHPPDLKGVKIPKLWTVQDNVVNEFDPGAFNLDPGVLTMARSRIDGTMLFPGDQIFEPTGLIFTFRNLTISSSAKQCQKAPILQNSAAGEPEAPFCSLAVSIFQGMLPATAPKSLIASLSSELMCGKEALDLLTTANCQSKITGGEYRLRYEE